MLSETNWCCQFYDRTIIFVLRNDHKTTPLNFDTLIIVQITLQIFIWIPRAWEKLAYKSRVSTVRKGWTSAAHTHQLPRTIRLTEGHGIAMHDRTTLLSSLTVATFSPAGTQKAISVRELSSTGRGHAPVRKHMTLIATWLKWPLCSRQSWHSGF